MFYIAKDFLIGIAAPSSIFRPHLIGATTESVYLASRNVLCCRRTVCFLPAPLGNASLRSDVYLGLQLPCNSLELIGFKYTSLSASASSSNALLMSLHLNRRALRKPQDIYHASWTINECHGVALLLSSNSIPPETEQLDKFVC